MTDLRERLIERVMSEPIDFEVDAGHGWQKATATLDHEASGRMVDAVLSALPRLTEEERARTLSALDFMLRQCVDRGAASRARVLLSAREKLERGAILPEEITDEMVEAAAYALKAHWPEESRYHRSLAARAALRAALASEPEPICDHRWVDVSNAHLGGSIISGAMCETCGALGPGALASEPGERA